MVSLGTEIYNAAHYWQPTREELFGLLLAEGSKHRTHENVERILSTLGRANVRWKLKATIECADPSAAFAKAAREAEDPLADSIIKTMRAIEEQLKYKLALAVIDGSYTESMLDAGEIEAPVLVR